MDAFWSLTMYDVLDFYLVANPIDRYSTGDRTPGLQTGRDGSVTIYLQTDSPGPDKDANWLPMPTGAFRPITRLYQPAPAADTWRDLRAPCSPEGRLEGAWPLRCVDR